MLSAEEEIRINNNEIIHAGDQIKPPYVIANKIDWTVSQSPISQQKILGTGEDTRININEFLQITYQI